MRYVHHRHHLRESHHKQKNIDSLISVVMWGVAILAPFATLPQIIDIYTTHKVTGLSITTWFLFVISPLIWFSYGLLHKDKFILINNFLWAILSSIVFLGILLYR